ncbi:MAG TPA: UDP-N-acetylmuramoyl-L-alanine--D-glutamate ligase [Ignavibacteria bacterium]|nr:UDP-N-acetylmuramoyl-L-alanine--D-glutamate ligase [Ignavibacteria bacterium]HQY51254.1 UDP-N-acetylmuramoyl-L-alanine--D-glutamate ligase [Ignavibacteria bacterium]HRA99938.1 UDP-N-acetylmuramoyl-L-alanine--D-glutamate ligase [Ignavibacteria bacterium]
MTDKRSFTILGAGRSGIAAAGLLKKNGYEVFLSEENQEDSLKYFNKEFLLKEKIEFETGGHSERIYDNDVFIVSPGIPPESEVILKAVRLGKKILSEIEVASEFCKCPIIAITGTNGKTTTAVLTGEIFRNAGYDVKVCGNVGLAFSEIVSDLKENSIVILEVSSFQLEYTENFRPDVSVILNITPDHIDWHKSFENYLYAKEKIRRNQTVENLSVLNFDDKILRDELQNSNAAEAFFSIKNDIQESEIKRGCMIKNNRVIYFDKSKNINEIIMETHEINIRGNHNLYNSLAALISARAFDIKKEIIKDTLIRFKGVEHRIEFVRELDGVKYYNDSKATNIDSVIVALESFEKDLILILGGKESGNDYSVIDKLVSERVKIIVAIGESKNNIIEHFSKIVKCESTESLDEAVKYCKVNSSQGDSVLLSPACKSFDMFDSYEHRGKEFKKAVNNL